MNESSLTMRADHETAPTARVLCRDPRLCRFFAIELAHLGIVAIEGDVLPRQTAPCLFILDGDDPRWRAGHHAPHLAARWDCPVLVFSRKAKESAVPDERVTYLRRPFSLDVLEDTLRRLTAPVTGYPTSTIPRPLSDHAPTAISEIESTTDTEVAPAVTTNKDAPFQITARDGVVTLGQQQIPLTPAEWAIFSYLYERPGETVPREELALQLTGGSNSVAVYIHHLRVKLEKPLRRRLIFAVRGEGYFWDA